MFNFENVKAFSAIDANKDLCDAMREYAKNYIAERKGDVKAFSAHSKEEMEALVTKEFMSRVSAMSGVEVAVTGNKTNAQRLANNIIVKQYANEIRDIMVDMVLPDILDHGALRYIAKIDYADLGDSIDYTIKNNRLFTVSKAGYRKAHGRLQKQYETCVTMTGENHEITVGDDLYNILTGSANIAEAVMKAGLSIEYAMLVDVIKAFEGAMANLSGSLAVANYDEKQAITLAETITAYNQGRKAIFIGTPVALKGILPSGGAYRYLLDDEYVKLGHLQRFNNYDVLPLEQIADLYDENDDYGLLLDDSKVYVVSPASDKLVKVGVFGGTITRHKDANDSGNLLQLDTINKAWNVDVITNSVAGIIKSFS
jgi:hypothetical protein